MFVYNLSLKILINLAYIIATDRSLANQFVLQLQQVNTLGVLIKI